MSDTRARSTSTVAPAGKARHRIGPRADAAGRSRSMSLQASPASVNAATTATTTNSNKSNKSNSNNNSNTASTNGSDGESISIPLGSQRPASASPVPEESSIMYTSPSKHLKARKGPTSRMHKLFPELADEVVLDDFSCALQKDILVHGRLFVSERHFCFHANIFGWVTKLVVDCREVLHLRKEKTALIIPNAVKLETTSKAYTFASFIARDTAYRCLFKVWQNALLDEPLNAAELLRSSVKGWHDNIGDESFMHSPSTGHLIDSVRSPRPLHVMGACRSYRSSTTLHSVGRSASSGLDEDNDVDDENDGSCGQRDAFIAEEEFEAHAGGMVDGEFAEPLDVRGEGGALVPAQDVPVVSVEEEGEGRAVVEAGDKGPRPISKGGRISTIGSSSSNSSSSRGSTHSGKHTKTSSVSTDPAVKAAATAEAAAATATHSKGRKRHKERKKHGKRERQHNKHSNHHARTASLTAAQSAGVEAATVAPPLSCDFGTMSLDVELPCSVDEAAQMLFSYSRMVKELYKKRKTTNVDISEWAVGEDGKRARDLGYTLALDYSFGPRTTRGEEHQVEVVPHVAGQYWIVDGDVFTPHVPYGDNFYTKTRTVVSRLASRRCRVQVCTATQYRNKRPWSLTRQLIESNSATGLKNYYSLIRQLLLKHTKLAHDARRASCAPSRGASLKKKGADAAAEAGEGAGSDGMVVQGEGEEGVSRGISVEGEEEDEEEEEEGEAALAATTREAEEMEAEDKLTMFGQFGLLRSARRLLRDGRMLTRAWRRYRITILSFLVWTLVVLMGYHFLMGDTGTAPAPFSSAFTREGAGAVGDLRTALPFSPRAQGALSRVSAALRHISEETRVLAEEVEAAQRNAADTGGGGGGRED